MQFNYKTYPNFSSKYDQSTLMDATGDYQGEATLSANIDGHEIELQASNEDHIIMMDIIEGSSWFDFETTNSEIISVGPYITHKVETVFAPKTIYNIKVSEDGLPSLELNESSASEESVKESALFLLEHTESEKVSTICNWIINDWNVTEFPAHMIVLPTIATLANFNI